MINLLGLTVKDKENMDGDIEIKIIGLRSGEKLFEELLIGKNPQKTYHPKIKKINDPFIPFEKLEVYIKNLENLITNNQSLEVKKLLNKIIKLYTSNSKIVDHIQVEQLITNKKIKPYNKL